MKASDSQSVLIGRSLLLLALLVTSCDRQAEKQVVSRPVVPAGPGIVDGFVHFNAPPPPTKIVGGDCCPGVPPAVDESIVVDHGNLANVVVFVENGPNVDGVGPTITVDQKGCAYHPHVSAVRAGQTIDITSHDAVMHNVHVIPEVGPQQNISQTASGASNTIVFDATDVVHLKCDVHPWMSAYVDVFDHPFFAVTDAAGHFRIDRLPPGTYTLVARHEMLGELRQTFTINGPTPVPVSFTYSGPS